MTCRTTNIAWAPSFQGRAHDQILAAYPDFTYLDIFRAAEEALEALVYKEPASAYQIVDIRKSYPRLRKVVGRRGAAASPPHSRRPHCGADCPAVATPA